MLKRTMSAEAIAIVGVGVTLLAVLVPLTLAVAGGIRGDVAKLRAEMGTLRAEMGTLRADVRADQDTLRGGLETLRSDMQNGLETLRSDMRNGMNALRGEMHAQSDALRGDVAEVRRDLHALGERVARIEGTLAGPWRPPVAAVAQAASEPSDENAA